MDNLTYTVYHKESDKIVASGLSETDLLNLIGRMIYKEVVTGIWLLDYVEPEDYNEGINVNVLIKDIESQGVFSFNRCWHVG
ncbi:terminal repeat-encoded protein [Staphylococcus phage vB_SauM_VL14]|nr:terminal repeat-encoded protein [Staphylococcus phage vB_SauM_VL14]